MTDNIEFQQPSPTQGANVEIIGNGDSIQVLNGGVINLQTGAQIQIEGVDKTANLSSGGGGGGGVSSSQVQAATYNSAPDTSNSTGHYLAAWTPTVSSLSGLQGALFFINDIMLTNSSIVTVNTFPVTLPGGAPCSGGEMLAGNNYALQVQGNGFVLLNSSLPAEIIVPNYEASIFYPVPTPFTSSTFSGSTNVIYFNYIGYVVSPITLNYGIISITGSNTLAGGRQNDLAICSSPYAPNIANGNPTLTLLATAPCQISVGNVSNPAAWNYTVPAGTYLWSAVSLNTAGSGTMTFGNSLVDPSQYFTQKFSGDYLSSGTTSWTTTNCATNGNGGVVTCPMISVRT